MPMIHKTAIVPYTPAQMYDLVNDIASYPEFVPWCAESHVLTCTEEAITATLVFARGSMKKAFTTKNQLQKDTRIEMGLLDGPFKHLRGVWCFEALAEGHCRVTLDLDFEFSTRLLGVMFGPLFHQVANRLVDAFHQRANAVYG